jgi:hypothetical protein
MMDEKKGKEQSQPKHEGTDESIINYSASIEKGEWEESPPP